MNCATFSTDLLHNGHPLQPHVSENLPTAMTPHQQLATNELATSSKNRATAQKPHRQIANVYCQIIAKIRNDIRCTTTKDLEIESDGYGKTARDYSDQHTSIACAAKICNNRTAISLEITTLSVRENCADYGADRQFSKRADCGH